MNRPLILALLAAAPVLTSPAVEPVFALQPAAQASQSMNADAFAARALVRTALVDLRVAEQPSTESYRVAYHLLGVAQQLAPTDTAIIRKRIQAAFNAGDQPAVIELTRRLVQLDPQDTVAQLRLITAIIDQRQTADERLALYDRYLGPQGRAIDASVRSRLALDAALLLRELGDEDGFRSRLKDAIALDTSNKEAATVAVTATYDQLEDPRERLELLVNLLYTDPVDPNIHVQIARMLADGGAFVQAHRFHKLGVDLLQRSDGSGDPLVDIEVLAAQWQAAGGDAVLTDLRNQLARARLDAENQLRRATELNAPTDNMLKPEDITLSILTERVRFLAADAAGDTALMGESLRDLERTVSLQQRDLAERVARPRTDQPPIDVETARAESARLSGALAMAKLWGDVDRELAVSELRRVVTVVRNSEDEGRLIEGWLKLRTGDPAGALEELEPIRAREVLALAGVVKAYEALNQTDNAIIALKELAKSKPLDLEGAWARDRLRRMKIDPPGEEPGGTAERLTAFAQSIPAWIDRAVVDPNSFMGLQARMLPQTISPLQPAMIRLTLQNLSPVPLSVGSDRPLISRFLIAPSLGAAENTAFQSPQPEVFDLDRRLRLNPRESITDDVWADPGYFGWLIDMQAGRTFRIRYRVLQGFTMTRGGTLDAGATGLARDTDTIVRSPLEAARIPAAALAERLTSAQGDALLEAMLGVRAITAERVSAQQAGLTTDITTQIAAAAAARYPTLDRTMRLAMLLILPHDRMHKGMAPVDNAARAEKDPTVLMVYIATRSASVDDPTLTAARDHPDAQVRDLAAAVTARLAAGVRTFGTLQTNDRVDVPLPPAEPAPVDAGTAPPGSR